MSDYSRKRIVRAEVNWRDVQRQTKEPREVCQARLASVRVSVEAAMREAGLAVLEAEIIDAKTKQPIPVQTKK